MLKLYLSLWFVSECLHSAVVAFALGLLQGEVTLWTVSSEAQVCAGRLFPRGKRLEMPWACCPVVLAGVWFIHFIPPCPVKSSSLCSSGLLRELPKSSSLPTLQRHLSPSTMWSMWLTLEKWKRKGAGIHSSGFCKLGNCSMPRAFQRAGKNWKETSSVRKLLQGGESQSELRSKCRGGNCIHSWVGSICLLSASSLFSVHWWILTFYKVGL